MGGFTTIQLKDISQENIDAVNAELREYGVRRDLHFYSEKDVLFEYESFKKGEGVWPEHMFPRDQINSLEDFKHYWSSDALGVVFVPRTGMLTFDCYFGRTSKNAMRKLGRWCASNVDKIESVSGSWSTFIERGCTRLERKIFDEYGLD